MTTGNDCKINKDKDCPFDAVEMGKFFQLVKDISADVKELKIDNKITTATLATLLPVPESLKQLNTKVGIQNGRVRALENWRWYLLGIFGTVLFFLKYMDKF